MHHQVQFLGTVFVEEAKHPCILLQLFFAQHFASF